MPKYIDTDKLNLYDNLFMKGKNDSGVWVRYRDVENLIKNAPTADVQEVRHGYYWGEARECIYLTRWCSYCKNRVPQAFYCLNCGTKMDRGENNEP